MNKLVSRNPVQRFKQGRKIVKAEGGLKAVQNSIYNSIYGTLWGLRHPIENTKRLFSNQNSVNQNANGNMINNPSTTKKSFKKGFLGDDVEKAPAGIIVKGGSSRRKGSSPSRVTNRVLPKYSGVDLQGKTVGEWQNILKKYYAPGTYKNDGIWGDNTEEAYRRYLTIANTDFTPVSKEPIEIPNNEDNNVNFDYEKFKRAALASDYTPDPIEQKLVSTPITYNRSMTRDWLRNNIGTAYGISGAMRAATRRKLNGQATDNDITLIKSNQKLYDALKNAGLFKKGGQLPSRNIVKRFKQKNFR